MLVHRARTLGGSDLHIIICELRRLAALEDLIDEALQLLPNKQTKQKHWTNRALEHAKCALGHGGGYMLESVWNV